MSDLIFVVATLLLLLYICWQLTSLYAWRKTIAGPEHKTMGQPIDWPTIALLVPFRNEAKNLVRLSESLLAQDYPGRLDLIFIDDHSSDGGAELVPQTVTLLQLSDYLKGKPTVAHKKAALTYAISSTNAEIIITTDADCYWPSNRVSCIAAEFVAVGADVVLGPVLVAPAAGFCSAFQALDLAAYQFLTAATAHQGRPALANGANFAFRRQLFEAVGGYMGVDHLPSGDDVLLLHKFYQPKLWPNQAAESEVLPPNTRYAANAAITTQPVDGWRALWNQRLRWAGKAGNYSNPKLSFAQALAFLLSAAIVLSLIAYPLHLRPRLIVLLWGGKAIIDLICLWSTTRHFGQVKTMKWYPLAATIYPFFLLGIGTAALLGFTTKWKGRS